MCSNIVIQVCFSRSVHQILTFQQRTSKLMHLLHGVKIGSEETFSTSEAIRKLLSIILEHNIAPRRRPFFSTSHNE